MKKQGNLKYILLIVYLAVILGIFTALVYPVIPKPKAMVPTKIPSLSVSGLREANTLFNNYGKVWTQYPTEPDPSNYTFGGKDPL